MNEQETQAQRDKVLEGLGIHTTISKVKVKDKTTGEEREVEARIVSKPDNLTVEALSVFSDHRPCWFKGCQELRDEFNKVIASIPGCPGCKRGKLILKYLPRAKELIKQHYATDKHNTGAKKVSGSGTEGTVRTEEHPSVLRRAAACIAKVFRAGKKA